MHITQWFMPIRLICPHCGFNMDFDETMDKLRNRVIIEIERRIHTGEFQKRVLSDIVAAKDNPS